MKKLLFTQRRLAHHRSMATVVGVVVLCILIFNAFFSSAQNPLVKQWDYRFGGTDEESLFSFLQTNDGGYLLAGYSLSGISGDKTEASWGSTDFWILKTDAAGSALWDKRYGGTDDERLYAAKQTIDGGYLLAGYSNSGIGGDKTETSRGSTDYWMVKVDPSGTKQWDKRFGGIDYEFINTVVQTDEGGYLAGGQSASGISGDRTQSCWGGSDYWIVKTDAAGIKQWDKRFGGTDDDVLNTILPAGDGGYFLCGTSLSGANGDKAEPSWGMFDYWVVKINSAGTIQWEKRYGGTAWDILSDAVRTPDGGCLLAGRSTSDTGGDRTQPSWGSFDYWVLKIDSLGNLQWDKRYGGAGYDYLCSAKLTSDKGFILTGYSGSGISGDKTENNLGPNQMWTVKIDSTGNVQWDKTILTSLSTDQCLPLQAMDGCYLFAGFTNSGTGGDKTQPNWDGTLNSKDYWLIKFCDSTLTTNIANTDRDSNREENDQLLLSPNPCEGRLAITSLQKAITKIEIYNTLGEKVLTAAVNREPFIVNCEQLPEGIYFVEATAGEKVLFGKVVKE